MIKLTMGIFAWPLSDQIAAKAAIEIMSAVVLAPIRSRQGSFAGFR